jgi:beta-lactamase superfamily II metal-dependent hydrolase
MELKVSFLNIKKHGDCTVITFDEKTGKACIVIDGGEYKASAKALRSYLVKENVDTIDLMIGTHIDQDHILGLLHFVNDELKKKNKNDPYIKIKEFWGPLPSQNMVTNIQPAEFTEKRSRNSAKSWYDFVIKSVDQNDDLYTALLNIGAIVKHPAMDDLPKNPFKNIKLEVLGPDTQIPADTIKKGLEGFNIRKSGNIKIKSMKNLLDALENNKREMAISAKRDANNQSIIVKLTPKYGKKDGKKWTFLFTGDAEEEAWDEMVSDTKIKKKLRSKILKIPHHGSHKNGITIKGAKKVKPDYSINLVGQKHGLPDKETISMLHNLNSKILCTQRNNDKKHKSDCYKISKNKCPAYNNPQTVTFFIDTNNEANNIIPEKRACKYAWPVY